MTVRIFQFLVFCIVVLAILQVAGIITEAELISYIKGTGLVLVIVGVTAFIVRHFLKK